MDTSRNIFNSKCAIAAAGIAILVSGSAFASTIQLGASLTAGGPTTILATGSNSGVSWAGPYGGLSFNVLAASDPSPNGPVNQLGSTLLSSSSGGTSGTVYFYVTEFGLTSPNSSMSVSTHFTENFLQPGWSVTESAYLDNSNTPFGTGTLLGTVNATGTLAQDVNSGSVSNASPYSLTEIYKVTYSPIAGSALSTEKILADQFGSGNPPPLGGVPEVSTWAMMLLGFAGLGFAGYKRRTAEAT